MIFIDEMKNMKIYRRQFFLPYNDKDKKHGSLIYLLTPNYLSSRNLMSSPITINRKYFESYYMERNVSYYIKSSASKKALEEFAAVINFEDKDTETEYLQDQFTAYLVSEYMDEEALRIAVEERHEDIYWYDSIDKALKGDRKAPGKYAVYTHEVNNMTPVKIGEIEVELIEFTDYKATYKWIAREEIETVDESSPAITFPTGPISGDVSYYPIDNTIIKKYKDQMKGLSHVRTSPRDHGYIFIDNKTGKPIGFISVEDKSGEKWIQALEIAPDFQRHGYGQNLLQFAQSQGAKFLSVKKNNDAALNLYNKNGWKIKGGTDSMHFMIHESEEFSKKLTKKDILSILKNFKYDKSQYCLVYKAALVLQDVLPECNDVDIEISQSLHNRLIKDGYKQEVAPLGGPKFTITDRLEAFTAKDFDHDSTVVDGFNCRTIDYCLKEYKRRNRPKDQATIQAIERYLNEDVSVGDPVYFCKDITPENILKLYETVGRELEGNVAVKLHSGEKGNQNFLGPDLYKLIIDHVNGTVVECNTAYPGARMNTEDHRKLMALHGWSENFDVDIMDSEGEIALPVDGEVLDTNLVGSHLKNYDSMLVLSHFKGHPMGGFGGALKNISIGVASSNGKKKIHRVSFNDIVSVDADFDQHEFIKAMSEAAGSVYKQFEGRMVFINVMKNISVDCDCVADAKPPCMADIGILASTNPVALDNACLSLIKSSKDPGAKHILERVEQRFGEEIITDSTWETKEFQIYDINKPLEHRVGDAGTYSDHYIIKRWNIVADDGSNNSCIMVQGYKKPMRSRTSVMVFKDGKIFARKNDNGSVSLPGGGWEPGEDAQLAGEREVQEEINVNIKNMRFAGTLVEYDEEAQDWVKENVKNPNDWWYGYYTMIFVADYDSEYTGYVAPIDRDEIKNQGDWYDIEEIYGSLCPEYQHAADVYLNSLTEASLPKIVAVPRFLYHGSSNDYNVLKATGLDLGNKLQNPGWSLYTWKDIDSAIGWGLFTCIKEKMYKYFDYDRKGCILSKTPVLSSKDYTELLAVLDSIPLEDKSVYVYTIDTRGKNYEYGLGHSTNTPNCITIRTNDDIVYCNKQKLIVTPELINKYSRITDKDLTDKDYGVNSRFASFLMSHDMMKNIDTKRALSKALRNNELKPGDDIIAFMKNNNISFNEADGPQTPEVDIPMPEIPDPGKDLQNFTRTLKMRAKKGLYQMNAHARDLEKQFPTADTILDSLKSGDHASSSNDEEETNEALFLPPESDNRFLMESVVICLDEDDSALDSKLKKTLYAERIRTSKDQLVLLKKVKADNKFIKYAYPDKFDRYGGKNVFYDLSYYIEVYFKNAKMFKMRKGVDLFNEFLGRLLDPKRVPATYTKKTVFIPVTDWTADGTKSWLFKNSINPISCIYDMIQRLDNTRLKKIFGKMDIIFFGNGCYFKLNFSELSDQEWKTLFTRFKTFVQKMLSNAPFTPDEEDEAPDVESTKVIATNIADKLETNRGIKMSTHAAVITAKAATGKAINTSTAEKVRAEDKVIKATKDVQASAKERVEKTTSKATPEEAKEEKLKDTQMTDAKKDKVVDTIVDVAEKSKNTAAALDALDDLDDEEFKRAILDLELEDGEEVKVSKARAARMNELNKKFEQKEVNGVKVSDLINEEKRKEEVNAPLPTTTIPVDSPFQDQWSDLKYINYDKSYDVNKDVMKMLLALNEKKFPIAIRDLRTEDTSTSEDYIDTYSIEMEDFRGKRFTVKMDIPKFKDNKYLVLRGNKKTIQNQYFNMPILKTDVDTVQIISNYSKIFIRRFGNTTGKTISYCDRLLKALKKYNGTAIKLTMGDNSKLSSTFEAPIDYIDIGSVYSKIEYNGHTFYFNQDEFKKEFKDRKMNPGQFYYGVKKDGTLIDYVMTTNSTLSSEIASVLMSDKQFAELYENVNVAKKHVYSKASIMSSEIPLIIVASLNEGLTTVLRKANIEYQLKEKLTTEDRRSIDTDWIKFSDGYLVYKDNYSSSLLLNGLKEINPEQYSIDDIDSQRMWIETLDDFGGRIKSDGLQNFYECMIDPITYEVLQHYNLPTDYVTILIYANNLLADNKYISHGDSSSRRLRRNELISVKVYKTLFNEAYAQYANMCRHNPDRAEFIVKQNAVIDKFMSDPTSSDLSIINCLNDVESANAVSTKGESGMNSERSYTLDKRTYDDSMLNILGLSTGFANNVGVTRQTTLDANIDTERGYVKSINGDTSQMSAVKSLTATEALNPMGSTRDDPQRTGMTFIQTAKHQVMTEKSDPLLVTNGADEVLPYMASDIFCKKAKADGKIVEFVTGSYFVVEYKDGSHDYINLKREIEKNSDGGFYVNTQLTTDLKEGSTVKKNQILAYEERSFSKGALGESNKLAYNVGKLIKIAVVNSDDNFEDSAMVTSKLAEDLATDIIMKEERILSKDTNIYNVIKPGTKVNQEDILFETQTAYDEEDVNILLKNLAGDEEQISKLGRRPVKSPTAGVIEGIRLYRTCEIEEMSESLQKLFKEYEREAKKTADVLKKYGIDDPTQYGSIKKLKPVGKLKNSPDSVLIEVYIKYHDIVAVGETVQFIAAYTVMCAFSRVNCR